MRFCGLGKKVLVIAGTLLMTGMLMGQGCPALVGIVDNVLGSLTSVGGSLLDQEFTSAPFTATFTPTQTGLAVNVVISSDNSGSRIAFTVTDPSGATVTSVTNPSTSTSSATFTPSLAGTYTIGVIETGLAGTTYVVQVTQSL